MTAATHRAPSDLRERLASTALVIFDCDGVLVDSEALSCRIDVELLGEKGVSMTIEEMMSRFVGLSYETMVSAISDEYGVDLGEFQAESVDRFVRAIAAELEPVAGMPGALERMKLPACVASSSPMHRIRRSLEVTGLVHHFQDRIYSADMVEAGKPAPDLFLLAASGCEVEPGRCIVVEDSPHGIAAARSAGMASIGFTGGAHCGEEHRQTLQEAGADDLIGDALQLERFFSQIIGGHAHE